MIRIAVILAGGSGQRMNTELPKQFLKIAGKTVIQFSIEAFINSKVCDAIIVVCHPDYTQNIPVNIIPKNIPFDIINGGKTRNHSTKNAIDFVSEKYKIDNIQILFHDAARPNLKSKTIVNITNNLVNYPVVVPVCKVTDTIYSLNSKDDFDSVVNRDNLVKAYTPQGFQLSVIKRAYKSWEDDGEKDFSDDVSIVHHFIPEADIFFIEDNPWNLKLTYPEDIQILEYLLKTNKKSC